MAVSVSPPGKYPGVYVQTQIDSQPPTGGAATSVGAFIGRTPRGRVNVPIACLSFADYERNFGGLSLDSSVSYQANGFFNNGGGQAEVVRLYRLPTVTITATNASPTDTGEFTLTLTPLLSGPTVQVTTGAQFKTTQPTTDQIYQVLGDELSTEPALAGMINVTSTTGGLSFELSYPCTLSGGGPDAWTITPATTGSGSAVIPFWPSISFTMPASGLAADKQAVIQFTPAGAAPFSVSFTNTGSALSDVNLAVALYKAIKQSSQASRLVNPTSKPTTSTLLLPYSSPVTVALTVDGVVQAPDARPDGSTPALQLEAANPGAWGDAIVASIDTDGINQAVADKYGLKSPSDLFNLSIIFDDGSSAASERFTAVTLVQTAGANRLDRVLKNQSALVRLTATTQLGGPAPASGAWGQGSGGVDSGPLLSTDYIGDPSLQTGLYAFNQKPYGFNIMSIPPDDNADPKGGDISDVSIYQTAAQICVDNNAMLILDPPSSWYDEYKAGNLANIALSDLGSYTAAQARACAVYFPRVIIADPLRNGLPKVVVPSGFLAAVWASVDAAVGVWKAPAGLDAPIGGILQLQAKLNDAQNGVLNPEGINALRFFTGAGSVVWGARTLRGVDQLADQYKYVPVQRLLDYIETSLLVDTRWAVFQPNGEALWSKLQNQISVFMSGLFTQGAFSGTSASQAYFVKCDSTTTTPADAAAGIVNVQVGFAPIYPAEFVVITISQLTASSS